MHMEYRALIIDGNQHHFDSLGRSSLSDRLEREEGELARLFP